MKKYALKPLLASLLLIGSCAAQAAHFEVLSYDASSRYTGTVDFNDFAFLGSDVSGGSDIGTSASGGEITAAYQHDGSAYGGFLGGSTLELSTWVAFNSASAIEYFGTATAVEKTIQLKVVADAGDVGSQVNVSFAGLSSAFDGLAGATGSFQTSIRILNGSSVLGSYSTKQLTDQNINFAFLAQANDILTLSASQGVHMNASGPIDASLTGMLNGQFTVTAVPEPDQYAMLLAGLGLLGVAARRRAR
ncbi:MAG: hypothetical protein CVU31_07330 [Betaproteobacteria bacterium HGW-Betaproteobacteria-4]|jgi:hypothetical protein|nr:MAG: hypothetical protein CVU31_07330 [Betaproteobacteria bacterium HGW-Betaproteobacteria-4]